jgi:hypothetical protein
MVDTYSLIALYVDAKKAADAIDGLHAIGIPDESMTVMTGVPYPEGSLGRYREWLTLPYIVLAGAIGGLVIGLFLAALTPHLYRLDVGGHPAVGFPPAAVIIFVFIMMATIVSTFLGVLWEMEFPRFGQAPYNKLVTDGYLGVLVQFPEGSEMDVRGVLNAHEPYHLDEPERMTL